MSLVAVYSMKGGVGKTTSAVNISYLASINNYQTLLCDMDPQGSASFYYRIKASTDAGRKGFTRKKTTVDDDIKGSDFTGLDVLPADFSYRKFDIALHEKRKAPKKFRKMFDSLHKDYDHIFLDCPPNLTLLTENIFLSVDYIICPVIPTTLSMRTLDTVYKFFRKNKLNTEKIIPFFSMVNARTKLHRESMADLSEKYPGFLETPIPELTEIEKMGIYRMPVVAKYSKSRAAKQYRRLFKEIISRID